MSFTGPIIIRSDNKSASGYTANGAEVIISDILTRNGVLHIVDSVPRQQAPGLGEPEQGKMSLGLACRDNVLVDCRMTDQCFVKYICPYGCEQLQPNSAACSLPTPLPAGVETWCSVTRSSSEYLNLAATGDLAILVHVFFNPQRSTLLQTTRRILTIPDHAFCSIQCSSPSRQYHSNRYSPCLEHLQISHGAKPDHFLCKRYCFPAHDSAGFAACSWKRVSC